jgi:hypothetical protein
MKLTIVGVLFGLAVILSACMNGENRAMQRAKDAPTKTAISWDSSKMRSVQKEWDSLCDSFGQDTWTQDNSEERDKMLDSILNKHLSETDLRELAASCGKLPVLEKDRSPFANSVLSHMVVAFVDSGNRKSLVTLLATRCPNRVYTYNDIEYYLALWERKKTLKHPILILGEAYSRCKAPEVRHDIAKVIRRGFATMQIPGLRYSDQKDDSYVENAMKWYQMHKDELAPNPKYGHNAVVDQDTYTIPLFLWKRDRPQKDPIPKSRP